MGFSKQIKAEVRKIRANPFLLGDSEPTQEMRGLQCGVCGDFGDHVCLPTLHALIDEFSFFADACWEAFVDLEQQGYFKAE